jgi:hypothetical protein
MGLNLSNEQIAQELDLDPGGAQPMTTQSREGIVRWKPEIVLAGSRSALGATTGWMVSVIEMEAGELRSFLCRRVV